MPTVDQSIPESLKNSLTASGFPFQTAVAREIRFLNGWSIHASEYPWRGPKEEDRFLDIIATNKQFVISVECKKTRQDTFTFLRPEGGETSAGQIPDFRCLSYRDFTPGKNAQMGACETWALWPPSPSCEFCIVSTNKTERQLERDASLVIRATEALAQDMHEMPQLAKNLSSRPFLLLPVIVTTAQLFTARYNPSEVSLETGEFKMLPNKIEAAPFVRFTKAFTTSKRRDFAQRSVFVVAATCLSEFLNGLELAPDQPKDTMPVQFYKGFA